VKAADQAYELVPVLRSRRQDRAKAFRHRHLNAAEAELDKARDLRCPGRPEQRDQHRGQLSKAQRRSSNNAIISQCDDQLSSQIPRTVAQGRLRRRVRINAYDSARRRLWAQLNISSVETVRHLDCGNRSRQLLVAQPRVNRETNEKECRALMVSLLHRSSTSRHSSGSKVARLPQRISVKPTGSRKLERGNQKKRHRHIRNNFAQQHQRLREVKTPEPFFFQVSLRRRD
jgi:hypothetical protein